MSIDLQRLAAFHLVAERGSLRKVAQELKLTVPAVSTRIRLLEEDLKIRLFDRHPNSLVLTPAGRQFRTEIAIVFSRLEDALSLLDTHRAHKQKIRISAGSNVVRLVSRQINAFLKVNDDVEISIEINGSATTADLVASGQVDIGIGYFRNALSDNLQRLFIMRSNIAFVCVEQHNLAARQDLSLRDVLQTQLVMIPGDSELRSSLSHAFAQEELGPLEITEVGSCQSALDMAIGGEKIAIVHAACIRNLDPQLKWLNLTDHSDCLDLSVIYRNSKNILIGQLAQYLSRDAT
ncbi:LysR substrate-binding domain-containing protein [Rhizobium puerariae]|uniref:LysR substrate-binding domain-containing protein n=1 Tax=Rhizobium puerariae TaxID=1585791 RepID=A0ABV6AIR5_9HYPH